MKRNNFKSSMETKKDTSKQLKVAVLGPEYSYSHLVAAKILLERELILCGEIEEVFKQVSEKKAEKGIVPIENMLHGSVRESITCLLKYPVKINQAYTLPINHCLVGKNKNYANIISHPQALAQCSTFLSGKNKIECSSTSKAMEIASQDHSMAAIGSKEAAKHYQLQILQDNIEDNRDNVTRFLVISLEETTATEEARTSLLLKPKEDKPGLLFLILAPLASQNINLLKIESLPSRRKMGEYIFYLEIDGNVQEPKVKSALDFLRNTIDVYSLGSYQVTDLR